MTIFLSLPCPFMARIHPLASFDFRLKSALDSYWYTVWLMTGAIRKELCLIRSTSGKSSSIQKSASPLKCSDNNMLGHTMYFYWTWRYPKLCDWKSHLMSFFMSVEYYLCCMTVIETIIHFEKHPTLTLKAQK